MDKPNPAKKSSDFQMMEADWLKVETLLGGIDVLKENSASYIEQFPDEDDDSYKFRVSQAKYTGIFGDIIGDLSARPFAEEVKLAEEVTDEELIQLAGNIDAQGHSLHEFAEESFHNSIAYGVDWILVDYTPDGPIAGSVSDEKKAGVRPFWRRYSATNCVAVYSKMIDGEEQFIHIRFREFHTKRELFEEEVVERIRVFDREEISPGVFGPPTVEIWEKVKAKNGGTEMEWVIAEDKRSLTIDVIPVVPLMTARRKGASWRMRLPMKPAADLQIEHFQAESNLKYVTTMAAFPVLSANGISPEKDEAGNTISLAVGPGSILYAPSSAGGGPPPFWQWIEPPAESLTFMSGENEKTGKEIRELGRQPLVQNMSNVITSAVAGQKGKAAVQAWALAMKKAVERALMLTSLWLKKPVEAGDITIIVNLDFDLTYTEDDGFDHVMAMRDKGDMSRAAQMGEAKRRGILAKDYDPDADLKITLEEQSDDLGDDDDEDDLPGGPPGKKAPEKEPEKTED